MPSSAPVDGVLGNGQRKQISTVLFGVQSTAFCLQMIRCFSKIIMCLTDSCMFCVPNISNGCPSVKTHWRNTGDTRLN
jgi:hypothetical protein